MTRRRSPREIESTLEDLEDDDVNEGLEIVVRDHVVDENGDSVVTSEMRSWCNESGEWHSETEEFDTGVEIDPENADWSVR